MLVATMPNSVDYRVVIIGAGPSGLSAAYELAGNGILPEILERTGEVGGLMRSIPMGDYVLDIGRKEMYSRIPEVVELWDRLLGDDYRAYPHRVGSLFAGRIVELSDQFRGIFRGVPFTLLTSGALSLARGRIRGLVRKPVNLQDHWHFKVGEVFARMFAQGYWEKFRGIDWTDISVSAPGDHTPKQSYSLKAVSSALRFAGGSWNKPARVWRHPRLGTGQLYIRLHEEIRRAGGSVRFGAEVKRITEQPDGTWKLDVVQNGIKSSVTSEYVISSISIEKLYELLYRGDERLLRCGKGAANPVLHEKRHVILVYLFLNARPQFPHAWIEVNDPALCCGRITNYSAFEGDMVPDGKTCLCVEFFCSEDNDILAEDDAAITQRAITECVGARLLNEADLEDSWMLRLTRTNAASSWRELQSEKRLALLEQLTTLKTFFHVNRPGSDWASLAGLFAGRTIATGSRVEFDMRADPTRRLPEMPVTSSAAGKDNPREPTGCQRAS